MENLSKFNYIRKYVEDFKKNKEFFLHTLSSYEGKNIDALYYYTKITVLENIFKNKTLWLSNSKYLNDSTEINYTNTLIYTICNEFLDESDDLDRLFKKNIDKLLNFIDKEMGDTYILSLTKNRDSLALWSNYSNYDGYNIGTNYEVFKDMFLSNRYVLKDKNSKDKTIFKEEDFSCDFGPVIYDEKIQREILTERIMFLYSLYKKYYDFTECKEFKILVSYVIYNIAYISAFFKDPGFEQEQEYRVVFRIINENIKGEIVNHRICNRVFIPYIEISFEDIGNYLEENKGCLRVTIGPKNNLDIAEIGLISFLNSEGYKNFDICKSKIPLRY